jgi:hypothetical protein
MKKKLIQWTIKTANNSWTEKSKEMGGISYFKGLYLYFLLKTGHAMAQVTGGSSKQYFYQWFSYNDLWWGGYSFIKGWVNLGWSPGKKILVYYFHGANSIKLLQHVSGIKVLVPKLTKDADIDIQSLHEFLDTVQEFKPYLVVTFPSLLFRICQLIHTFSIPIPYEPPAFDLSADFLFTCQYQFIQSIFKTSEIRLTYGTIEFGQIAQQVSSESLYTYRVYSDIARVENLNERLVVTQFHYRTLPMIRYYTDDWGRVEERGQEQYIHNLIGKNNTIDTNFLELDRKINSFNQDKNIINLRLKLDKDKRKREFIFTLKDKREDMSKFFIEFGKDVKFVYCQSNNCKANDNYDRKNTPVLDDYVFQALSPSTSEVF